MSDKTLLDITQEILNSMTGDEVNSIFDTAEAEAVARIVVSVFEGLVSNRNWAQHKSLFQLESFNADLVLPRKTPEKASGFESLLKGADANKHEQTATTAPTQGGSEQPRRQSFEVSARRAFECVNDQK